MTSSKAIQIVIATGIYPPDSGGPATYSKLLYEKLPAHGFEVSVLTFGLVRNLPKVVRHAAYFFKALRAARKADALFAQDTVSVGLPSLLASRLARKKFFIRVPGDYAWEQATQRFGVKDTIDDFQTKRYGLRVELLKKIQRFVVGHADVAVAPSKYFAALVDGWTGKLGSTHAIYNGVDIAATVRIVVGAPRRDRHKIVSSGRLVPWKGFEQLIRAMKRLPTYNLDIAGDGPLKDKLQELIESEGLSGRVKLLGRIDRAELMRRKAEAGIYALNTSFESFSFDIVEALALGTPVIATKVGNLPEIIEHGESGYLVTPDSIDEIVSTVARLEDDREYERISANARKRSELFSVERTVEFVAMLLRERLGKMAATAPKANMV